MENSKGIPVSRVSPAFLHANSTSHTWAFSAIAEIIDNAYDPDVNASELWIDKIDSNNTTCLTFTDNGAGLNPDKLLKMLSFGFCEKSVYESKAGHKPIGHYGNGFKSGSMRIAKDVLVFTRHLTEQSVGMLSQTFLNRTKAETVVVPLVTWSNKDYSRSESNETINNLRAINTYSYFKTEDDLLAELKELESLLTGTRIILYNLKADKMGQLELDFESNLRDILNPQSLEIDVTSVYRPVQEAIPRYQISLREYCSILFLKPRMKIVLRGVKVKTKLICKSLSNTETDRYKPQWLDKPIKITYGFTCSHDTEEYGIMMYHRNRLIKAFEKVGYQKQPNDLGVGIVGIVEVNFLQPIHNKQDFNKDERYNTFMAALAIKTNEYWNEKKSGNNSISIRNTNEARPDWLWAQCENCLKWRRLPDGINRNLPDKWYCYMNSDASHNRCEIEEEPEDEDLSIQHASYQKTFKKEMEKKKSKIKFEEHKIFIKKEKELQEREEKFKARVQTVEKICTEVTSTQLMQKKKTETLQRMLQQAKQREAEQRHIILELQAKKLEVKRNKSIAAENLKLSNYDTSVVLDNASELVDGSCVSSTSGTKRKFSGSNDKQARKKQLIVKEEDTEDVIAIIPDDVGDVIDLTSDNENSEIKPDPILAKKNSAKEDVKPNIKELDKQVNSSQAQQDSKNFETIQSIPEKSETSKNISLVSMETQTTKVTVYSINEDLETNKTMNETEEFLKSKTNALEDVEQKFLSLQTDIHSLLKIIVPGVDFGEVSEIETIVSEMIRVNKDGQV